MKDIEKVLKYLYDGMEGGHYAGDTTTHKFVRVGYFWPTLFKDAHDYVHNFQAC